MYDIHDINYIYHPDRAQRDGFDAEKRANPNRRITEKPRQPGDCTCTRCTGRGVTHSGTTCASCAGFGFHRTGSS